MKVFLCCAHNKPSGGTKVVNQVTQLFNEKGIEAYMVIPGEPYQADFMDNPAPTIGYEEMIARCTAEDIIIDTWQFKSSWKAIEQCPAHRKIFWSHGASIPVGKDNTGAEVFKKSSIYTDQWNVSKACADYIQHTYNTHPVKVIHPFFDTPILRKYEKEKNDHPRKGLLILARRGASYIPAIKEKFQDKTPITVMEGRHTEDEFFQNLLRHKFYVSVDNGVSDDTIRTKVKRRVASLVSQKAREKNYWIVPKGNLLGFPMPPAEAAILGTPVIGFAMGGGLEWMSAHTCFLAKDRDLNSLLSQIEAALNSSEKDINTIRSHATQSVKIFTKEHTWNQIKRALDL